jgi:C4-type Zn-finger protein
MPYVEYDETEAVCPVCGSTFRSPEALEGHLRESHAEGQGPGPEVRPREVRCSVCGARLPSVTALERHNRQAHVA